MGLPSKSAFKAAFQSKEAFKDFVQSAESLDNHTAVGQSRWTNKDLEPTPPEQRTWTWYNLPLFWFATAYGTAGWNAAASLIAAGMTEKTWQQTFISAVLGSLIAGLVVIGMARPGVLYHVGFPVVCRSSMGMYGSMFFIFIRGAVCLIWYGINTYYGANLMSTMLRCIFGHIWANWENTLPLSADVTSKQLLCFFLVWFIELPFCFIHPNKVHYLFSAKGIIMPFAAFGLFGWCMANGTGLSQVGIVDSAADKVAVTTPLGWAVMAGINTVLGTLSPMLVNQPDLARYCKKPRDAGWVQGLAVFVAKILVLFLGLASTASMQGAWGTAYCKSSRNLWDLNEAILDHHWTAAARCGVFLVSFSFCFSVVGTNVGGNTIPFGSDISGLFPRYMTIRRGQVICAVVGVCLVPWKLIATAQKFLTFLGSYNIFMAPLCGVMICDYCFGRKGNIHVPSLYTSSKAGIYWYKSGVNFRGVFAWCAGVAMGLPGLVAAYNPTSVSQAGKNMYKLGWILTFVTAFVVHLILIKLFKEKVYPDGYESLPTKWEYLAKEGREGFFDGEGMDHNSLASEAEGGIVKVDVHVGEKEQQVSV